MRNLFSRNGEMTFVAGLYKGIPAWTPGYDESFLKQAKMTLHKLDLKDLNDDDSFNILKMVRQYLWIKFMTRAGVRQGQNDSPTPFAVFINSLAVELKQLNIGITIGHSKVSILLSSDQLLRSPVIGRLTLNTEPYSGLAAAPG